MPEPGLVLTGDDVSMPDRCLMKVAQFFGVPLETVAMRDVEMWESVSPSDFGTTRLLCRADVLLGLLRDFEQSQERRDWWKTSAHSAFVYWDGEVNTLEKLVSILTGHKLTQISREQGPQNLFVTDELDDFCKTMAGLRVGSLSTHDNIVLDSSGAHEKRIDIISTDDGAVFMRFQYEGVPVFLSTSREIIDTDAELVSQNFDVREHFLCAVPLVLYIKWAFPETCWNAPEASACLVIDDPLLKPTHGFVDFQELLSLMKRHTFSTNIAFIPWNWRRSAPEVVRLFKENPGNYSVSVHGCDHTRAEFGSSSQQRLYWKSQQALERMSRHESITGIRHDPVMVFPQGIFSEAAMSALKRTDLIAAVNNDIISADPYPRAITVSDVWDIAVMGYPFPLFTRRYPWEGVENFAFDALLGKPTIAVIHHDYCSDHCVRLVNFIQRLNALKIAPTWRSLGEVVRRSCRQREVSPEVVEVEMYGTELRIENRSEQPKPFLIRRRECEPSAIREIRDGSGPIAWNSLNGHINLKIDLNPAETKMVSIRFHELAGNGCNGDTLPYRLKTMLRRYLCEVRDNYVTTARLRLSGSRRRVES